MKKWRRVVAAALAGAMMVSSMGLTAFADENGVMLSNQLLKVVFEGDPGEESELEHWVEASENSDDYELIYLAGSGSVVTNNWRKLDDNGKPAYNEDTCNWYYFDENGFAVRSDEPEEFKAIWQRPEVYVFGDDGVMLHDTFVYDITYTRPNDVGTEDTITVKQGYVGSNGNLFKGGVNRYIDSETDEGWYYFNGKGYGKRLSATDSNALAVYEIQDVTAGQDTNLTVNVGETKNLVFNVEFASDSNANVKDYHDIYVVRDFNVDKNSAKGMLTKSFTAKYSSVNDNEVSIAFTANAPGVTNVLLYLDGEEAAKTTVTSVIPEDNLSKATDIVVASVLSEAGDGLDVDRISGLKEIADTSDAQMKAMESSWVTNEKNVKSFAGTYAFTAGIETQSTDVSLAAEETLGDMATGTAVVGAEILANEKGSVQLQINEGNADDVAAVEAKVTGNVTTTAIDIDPVIDGTAQTETELPVILQIPAPDDFEEGDVIYHVHDGDVLEIKSTDYSYENGVITFAVSKFSTFVFVKAAAADDDTNDGGNNNTSNDTNDHTTVTAVKEETAAPVITTDAKKGQVNSETGIITGTGAGYSEWIAGTAADGTTSWKFEYADGTLAAGTIETRADGTTYVQPAWEMINGKWFAFGADAQAMSFWVAAQ